jgi:hypothetical protein
MMRLFRAVGRRLAAVADRASLPLGLNSWDEVELLVRVHSGATADHLAWMHRDVLSANGDAARAVAAIDRVNVRADRPAGGVR